MIKDKKLRESLKGIFDGEIKIYDIDNFLQQQGVLVDIHAGRSAGQATLNPKLYGVDVSKDGELSSFRNNHMIGEKISFLPRDLVKKFIAIESSTRYKKKELSMGFEDKYMPIEVFKEFNEYVKVQQEKYIEQRDIVLSQWDDLKIQFKKSVDIMLDKLDSLDKEEIKDLIYSKIPSRECFKADCKLELEVLAFPTSQNLAILDEELSEEIKETLEKKSLKTVYEILGSILSDSFDVLNNAMKKYDETDTFKTATLDSIKRLRERIIKRNILKHPTIAELIDRLDLSQYVDDDEIQEALEDASVLIYAFAKSIDIDIFLDLNNSFLDEKSLQALSLAFKF